MTFKKSAIGVQLGTVPNCTVCPVSDMNGVSCGDGGCTLQESVFTEGIEGLEFARDAVIVAEGGRIGGEVVVVKGFYRDAEISQVQCTTV